MSEKPDITIDTINCDGQTFWRRQDVMYFLWRCAISHVTVSDVARKLEETIIHGH